VSFSSGQDKRSALVNAAATMIHMRGYEGTTLSLVADSAKVPIGNVYYYFQSKEALTMAVLQQRAAELRDLFRSLEAEHATADARVCGYITTFANAAEHVAIHGCPYGGLSQELSKRKGPLGEQSSLLFDLQIQWLTTQYKAIESRESVAKKKAKDLVCAIQGACVLSAAMRDPGSFRKKLKELVLEINHDRNKAE
jgi:TetR/AcrR family transcriptional regulator, transcriptional repressor for nem operon